MTFLPHDETDCTAEVFAALYEAKIPVTTVHGIIFADYQMTDAGEDSIRERRCEKAKFTSIAALVEHVQGILKPHVWLSRAWRVPEGFFAGTDEHIGVSWLVDGKNVVDAIATLEEDQDIDFKCADFLDMKRRVLSQLAERAETEAERRFLNGVALDLTELEKHREFRGALRKYWRGVR